MKTCQQKRGSPHLTPARRKSLALGEIWSVYVWTRTNQRVFREAPNGASTDQKVHSPWMPSLFRRIITRQRLNYLVLLLWCDRFHLWLIMNFTWLLSFKNPCYGGTDELAASRPSVSSECCRTTSDMVSLQKGGPYRHITFHKNKMLHLPVISWTFIVLLNTTHDQVDMKSCHEWWTNSLPQADTKTLCLAPPEG